ncbi:MAG: 50S ribosomal protein L35 [Chitinophagales bacterium]|jgi:large subunit ribosomal protein L35|nr:50S ribosomal protein L35 [Chitinophagales bacterium]HNI44171.1 50S ribosomal protein L35 [Chitinophagales bacterium]HNL06870.1 50S ribosomal protein L35 [Chitinophagales bacterium]
MPKMKTHSSAKKRFKLTGTGKVKRHKAWKSHLLGHKSNSRKRRLNRAETIKPCDMARIKLLLCI